MGLDMYLEGRTFNWQQWDAPEKNEMRDGYRVKGVTLDLGYWRKHPNLHGYIVKTFGGGVDECQEIPLDGMDILKIIEAIKAHELPHTEGFFFGSSCSDDDAPSIKIFEDALKWLQGSTPPKLSRDFEPVGGGMSVLAIKSEDFVDAKESREVFYRASW